MSGKKHTFRTAEDYRDHLPCEDCEPGAAMRTPDPYVLLQQLRREHRRLAHVYVHTDRKDRKRREEAAERMETAAIGMALAAAQCGVHRGVARPTGAEGVAWEKRMDPENDLDTSGKDRG